MSDLHIAFWNLQNLFDTTASPIAADLDFTPAEGWTDEVLAIKIARLAEIITLMHNGAGPHLFGVCEIENADVAQRLLAAIGRPDLKLAHHQSPDLRGIDTALFYSEDVFEIAGEMKSHLVHLRYPTRDIFEVPLRVKATGAELTVLVNHWPSRMQGRFETEPFRVAVAERCGRIVDEIVRYPAEEFFTLPNTKASLDKINARWNRNILLMGDFNDEPFDRSIMDYLQATKDLDLLSEEIKPAPNRKLPRARAYIGRDADERGLPLPRQYLGNKAYLFNCMWPLMGRSDTGTHYFSGGVSGPKPTHTMNMLDQFMISRGLLLGASGLRLKHESVQIFAPQPLVTKQGRPRAFDRDTKRGYSDHLPIQCVLETT